MPPTPNGSFRTCCDRTWTPIPSAHGVTHARTPGNRGVRVLRRTSNGVTEYLLTTLWDSIDAIKAFAGEDYERARYYPEDDEYLLEREEFVTHYEVLADS